MRIKRMLGFILRAPVYSVSIGGSPNIRGLFPKEKIGGIFFEKPEIPP